MKKHYEPDFSAFAWIIPLILVIIGAFFLSFHSHAGDVPNPVTGNLKANQIAVPKDPVQVRVEKAGDVTSSMDAMQKAIFSAGDAAKKQCRWSDEKLEGGAYDAFVQFNVWNDDARTTAFAQAVVDKSVCPENSSAPKKKAKK